MKKIVGFLLLSFTPAFAGSPPPTVVRPLAGYVCMKLNVTEAQVLNPQGTGIYLKLEPRDNAPTGTLASSVVFVRSPAHAENGDLEAMQITGKPGWIKQTDVRPMNPTERCVPSMMSNGHIGAG